MELEEYVDLRQRHTFHTPVKARYFTEVSTLKDLKEAVVFAQAKCLSFLVLGEGSNLLFRSDFPGIVISLALHGRELVDENDDTVRVRAACGENWHGFVNYCLDHGYYGLENLSLIPGTVGAAPVQNIGAYGVEVAQFIDRVDALDMHTGEMHYFRHGDCRFAYRDSIFKGTERDRFIIIAVIFRLYKTPQLQFDYAPLKAALAQSPTETITAQRISTEVCRIRRARLPDDRKLGNAGSFFWNPRIPRDDYKALQAQYPDIPGFPSGEDRIKVPAAWLIEQAGWKGYRDGDSGVHEHHALVLVNHGEATGNQIYDLAQRIQASVEERFGIALDPEVRII